MNETIQSILNRRSIRKYKSQQITSEQRDLLIQCAMFAPSAAGRQPWHFTVIQKAELIDEIVEGVREVLRKSDNPDMVKRAEDPNFHTFFHAPTVILVSGKKDSGFAQIDGSAATENILIAATSLGLGTCYIASSNQFLQSEKGLAFYRRIGIPEEYIPCFSIAVGYPDGMPGERAPRAEGIVKIIE